MIINTTGRLSSEYAYMIIGMCIHMCVHTCMYMCIFAEINCGLLHEKHSFTHFILSCLITNCFLQISHVQQAYQILENISPTSKNFH